VRRPSRAPRNTWGRFLAGWRAFQGISCGTRTRDKMLGQLPSARHCPNHLLVAKLATTKGDTATVTAVTGLQELDLFVVVVVVVGHRWLVLFEMNKLEFIGWTDLLFAEGGRQRLCFHGGWTVKLQCSRRVDDDTVGWTRTWTGLVICRGWTKNTFFTEGGGKQFVDLGGWTVK
jgi:hypothetical protein